MHPFHKLRTTDPNAYERELRRVNPAYRKRKQEYLRKYTDTSKWRANANERSKKYFRKQRELILWLLGNKCKECGFANPQALQVDHIHGKGNKEGRLHGAAYYREILESIERGEEKYQLLCANHNWIKREEQKECYKRIRNPGFKEVS